MPDNSDLDFIEKDGEEITYIEWSSPEDRRQKVKILNEQGWSIPEMAKMFQVSVEKIRVDLDFLNVDNKYPHKQGGEWLYENRKERIALVETMLIEGKDTLQIAEELGCNPETIGNDVKEINFERRYVSKELQSREKNIAIEHRLSQVALLFRKGFSKAEIAQHLEVSPATITRDFKILMARWRETGMQDFNEAKTLQMQKLAYIEQELHAAYERGLGDDVIKIEKTGNDADGPYDELITQTRTRPGDYRYLSELRKVIDQQNDLMGIKPRTTTLRIETWQDKIIDSIVANKITEQELVDELGEELAIELMNKARTRI